MNLDLNGQKAVAIVSGGLDSVTLAHLLAHQGAELHLLAFDYGQKHKKELEFARDCAMRLKAGFDIVDLSGFSHLISNSALTSSDVEVPHGHYAAPTMSVTVVPNRNAILLALAYGVAVNEAAQIVATGVHGGDHFIYPDCRPAFIKAFDVMEKKANEGFGDANLRLLAPFLEVDKTAIVRIGDELEVPFARTWSCYEGGETHCGQCGTCVERREAFALAGVKDPTIYATSV
ncbi:7-cyano-7-deazaguanine synthase [Abditibacteriota bacterium]|nr:7-cyano-7-deazaguanine synthase [Abditibacteriota bacterium]